MSDSNRNSSSYQYFLSGPESSFTIPHVDSSASIPHYTHTYEHDTGGTPSMRSQVTEYRDVEGYGFGSVRTVYVERATTAGGRWSSEYPGEPSSTGLSYEPTSWSQIGEMGYSNTVGDELGNYSEAPGTFGSRDGGMYQQQPQYDANQATGSVSYAQTYRIESGWPTNPQISELEQQSASYQQVDGNSNIDRGPPQHRDSYTESNYTPSTCPLQGCQGTFVFPTLQSYRTHQKGVHHKNIYCHILGCPRNQRDPFNSENDRRRHHTAKHDPNPSKPFRCERDVCPARAKAFTRSDKLLAHDRKYHQFLCQLCPRIFPDFEELSQHTNFDHQPGNV